MPNQYSQPKPDLLALIAATLRLEYGVCNALCYGSGSTAADLPTRQQEFLQALTNTIVSRSSQASRVHLHGHSLASVHADLLERDIDSSWTHPQPLQVDLPTETEASDPAQKSALLTEELATDLDCLLYEGTISYPDQLEVLSQARAALVDEGCLILFGENLDDDSLIERSPVANLSSLKQLAERLGFALLAEQDYSNAALHCAEAMLKLVDEHRTGLCDGMPISLENLQHCQQELQAIIQEFRSGRRCFRMFILQKQSNPPGEYARAEYGDITSFEPLEVQKMFEASFGVDFDAELWNWKYQLGSGVCVVARAEPGGEIVSHYGGAPRRIEYFGDSTWAIQPCDVMVLPEVRRQYGRSSLFFKTAATFLEREIGNTVNHLLGFGFPNQKAMNIALRLGLYEKTDDFVELNFPATQEGIGEYSFEPVDIENTEHKAEIDTLWQSMRGHFAGSIIGVRDSDYIRYRYFDHPFKLRGQYRPILLRDKQTGVAKAFLVLKAHDAGQLLMDVICAPSDTQRMISLLNAYLCEGNRQNGGVGLKLWITKNWVESVQCPGATVKELGIEIPCNSWNPGPGSDVLYGAWWLTAGDMDFV